jgi:hypothetical protein
MLLLLFSLTNPLLNFFSPLSTHLRTHSENCEIRLFFLHHSHFSYLLYPSFASTQMRMSLYISAWLSAIGLIDDSLCFVTSKNVKELAHIIVPLHVIGKRRSFHWTEWILDALVRHAVRAARSIRSNYHNHRAWRVLSPGSSVYTLRSVAKIDLKSYWALTVSKFCKCAFMFMFYLFISNGSVVKGKAIPLQAWTNLEGSRRLKLPDFKTIDTWRW